MEFHLTMIKLHLQTKSGIKKCEIVPLTLRHRCDAEKYSLGDSSSWRRKSAVNTYHFFNTWFLLPFLSFPSLSLSLSLSLFRSTWLVDSGRWPVVPFRVDRIQKI
jgi:hypothetical protein